jgi:hypothetical protein
MSPLGQDHPRESFVSCSFVMESDDIFLVLLYDKPFVEREPDMNIFTEETNFEPAIVVFQVEAQAGTQLTMIAMKSSTQLVTISIGTD